MPLTVMLKELRLTTFSQNLENYQRDTGSAPACGQKLCELEPFRFTQSSSATDPSAQR